MDWDAFAQEAGGTDSTAWHALPKLVRDAFAREEGLTAAALAWDREKGWPWAPASKT